MSHRYNLFPPLSRAHIRSLPLHTTLSLFRTDVGVDSVDTPDASVNQQLGGVRGHQLVGHENLQRRLGSECCRRGRDGEAQEEGRLHLVVSQDGAVRSTTDDGQDSDGGATATATVEEVYCGEDPASIS